MLDGRRLHLYTLGDCKKGRFEGGTGCERADWSIQGRPKCHRAIATPLPAKQANRYRHARMTRAVRPTKLSTAWTRLQRQYGTPPKIRLPGPAQAISKKHRSSTEPAWRPKFEIRYAAGQTGR